MPPTPEAAIGIRNLVREFSDSQRMRRVLENISADFARGESFAIRGRSGSGKSTLLNLIGAIDVPDAGSISVAGINLVQLPERERTLFRRRHIGFVYQAFNLLPTLSVADNIHLVLELNHVPPREARKRVRELLTAVGLADRADSFPDLLSGGEQQRVAIARALSHRPSVLLADEPTGNLDAASAEVVLDLLDNLLQNSDATLLIATHSSQVAACCDHVIELQHGRLATERDVLLSP